tara:strand:- start:2670 stop:3434 length:765 start_codon:yes stop_codon:yes gene_type:complete
MEYLNPFLPSANPLILFFLISAFLVAGIIKGFLGMGLPTTVMALLTLVMEPTAAIPLLTIPIFVTNFAQYIRSSNPLKVAKNYKYFSVSIMISILITSMFITSYPQSLLTTTIGLAMVIFSLQTMFGIKIPVGSSYKWHVPLGVSSGILGGLSSIWAPPIAMYLISKNYSKDEFVSITGFLFLSGSLPLALGLYISGILNLETILQSLIGLIITLIGFRIGELMRRKVPQDTFRKVLLVAFLVMGSRLIVQGIL